MDAALIRYLETGLIVAAVISLVIWFIRDTIHTIRRNNTPVETDRAVAYFKHPESETATLRTLQGYRNEGTYFITFHTDHGEAVKLYMTGQDFFEINENDVGMLTWQGTRFWKFEPDRKED